MSEALSIFTDDDLEQIRKRAIDMAIESAARAAAAEIVPEVLPAIREALEGRRADLGAMITDAMLLIIEDNLTSNITRERIIAGLLY